MPRLLLLRHAKSSWPAGVSDRDRPLARRGHEAAALMGRYLKEHGLSPDLVLVSPARRARETWELVAPFLDGTDAREDGRIYEAPVGRLLEVLAGVAAPVRNVLMVGHNPGFEDLAALLIGAGSESDLHRLGRKFPTAGLAVIDLPDEWQAIEPRTGRLDRFVTPKSLGGQEDD